MDIPGNLEDLSLWDELTEMLRYVAGRNEVHYLSNSGVLDALVGRRKAIRMNILFVHNYYQQRGGEDVVFELERDLLRRNGHHVAEYCRNNSELKQLNVLGKIAAVKTTVWAGDSHRDLSSLLKREQYDVVHVHNTFVQISPSIYWACREANVPVVQTLHNYRLFCPSANLARDSHVCRECIENGVWRGVWHGCYRGSRPATAGVALMLLVHRYCGTWMNCVDRYIALSQFSREQFVAAGLPAEKIRIKPNFVDPDPGCRTKALDYAVYIGRLSEEKGVEHSVLGDGAARRKGAARRHWRRSPARELGGAGAVGRTLRLRSSSGVGLSGGNRWTF